MTNLEIRDKLAILQLRSNDGGVYDYDYGVLEALLAQDPGIDFSEEQRKMALELIDKFDWILEDGEEGAPT